MGFYGEMVGFSIRLSEISFIWSHFAKTYYPCSWISCLPLNYNTLPLLFKTMLVGLCTDDLGNCSDFVELSDVSRSSIVVGDAQPWHVFGEVV